MRLVSLTPPRAATGDGDKGPGVRPNAPAAPSCGAARLLALALGRDAHDVLRHADLLQRPDQHRRDIDLEAAQALARRAREGVVVVVPGLAEGRDREPEHVRRLVLDVEAPAPEEVAERVDRARDVVEEEQHAQA